MKDDNLIHEVVDGFRKFMMHKGNKTCWNIIQTIDALYKNDEMKPFIVKAKQYTNYWHFVINLPPSSGYSKFKSYEQLFAEAIGGVVFIERQGKAVYLSAYEQELKSKYPYSKHINPREFKDMLLPLHFGFSALGKVIHDLSDLEGILIGGNRGTGKSYLIISLVTNLLLYSDAIIGIIDYKQVDTGHFQPYVAYAWNEELAKQMIYSLNRLLTERIKLFASHKCNKLIKMRSKGIDIKPIIIVADELAEITDEEVLTGINRLLRLGRAVGFYMIGATQRPSSTNVKNNWGDSKALLPTRVCLSVSDIINSRMILDNDKGADIPLKAKGRCIFQYNQSIETQTLFLEPEESEELLKKENIINKGEVIYESAPKRLLPRQSNSTNNRETELFKY